ncbi:ATP-dependent DNA helicase RecG [Acidobacteriia bacterium AH_259_A11_L15]|nr:ATP-dependent DNA helicase RecG [Acidobacteriia bacterium AH_259_A11_L15]
MALSLASPVTALPGVASERARHLRQKGIETLEDLLYYFPFRYENRIRFTPIAELRPGQVACVQVEVLTAGPLRLRRQQAFNLAASDQTGILYAKWFTGYRKRFFIDYLTRTLRRGRRVVLYGKVEHDSYRPGQLQILQPQYEVLSGDREPADSTESGRIVPIYEAAGPISSRIFRRLIYAALERLPATLPDPLPASLFARYGFPDRRAALAQAHFPGRETELAALEAFRTPAQQRLIYEEFFFLQLGLALKRRRARQLPGIPFQLNDAIREAIKKILPFHPTAAQKRVLKEIADDMQKPAPMNRLLQGDVGSGKTIVAFEAAILAIENGYQVALMAPTEILAAQHFLYACRRFAPTRYRLGLLVSALPAGEKKQTREDLAAGDLDFLVGTHALLEKGVRFARLGFVIVDEQHRFGVLQRLELIRKGLAQQHPHVLVMTATPIPRTLALTLYTDLEMSILDEMPPGRAPIETRWVQEDAAAGVWEFIRKQVRAGRQAYIVYPVIEESKQELKAATREYERLSQNEFKKLRVGLLHGRLSGEEKERVMQAFHRGQLQVLVSTSVVEVGVDVPNASVMVIEHAERFGLSQLHQLRGRIGRGPHPSACFLMTPGEVGEVARERLQTLTRTQDGFQIAELDLQLRGPGEFLGTRQHGFLNFRIANLLRDHELLSRAKQDAFAYVEEQPPDFAPTVDYVRQLWQQRYRLGEVA